MATSAVAHNRRNELQAAETWPSCEYRLVTARGADKSFWNAPRWCESAAALDEANSVQGKPPVPQQGWKERPLQTGLWHRKVANARQSQIACRQIHWQARRCCQSVQRS